MSLSGGCQCGKIRFRVTGAPGDASICHCRMCQKAFGNFGAALVTVGDEQIEWTRGRPAEFRSSAIVARGFCAGCGTPLYMKEGGDPTHELAMGAFDDPNALPALSRQSGIESRVHWFETIVSLPAEETSDYRTAEDLAKLKSLQHPDHDTDHWPPEDRP